MIFIPACGATWYKAAPRSKAEAMGFEQFDERHHLQAVYRPWVQVCEKRIANLWNVGNTGIFFSAIFPGTVSRYKDGDWGMVQLALVLWLFWPCDLTFWSPGENPHRVGSQDFDGQDQGPLHSGFSGIMVPVTPITHISEETIQAATNQQEPWNDDELMKKLMCFFCFFFGWGSDLPQKCWWMLKCTKLSFVGLPSGKLA